MPIRRFQVKGICSKMVEIQGFTVIQTDDGSPSLCLDTTESKESMHNRAGAFSETLAIYIPALDHLAEHTSEISVVCVGFGLGYVETMVTAKSLHDSNWKLRSIESFEYVDVLYEKFNRYLNSPTDDGLYQRIFSMAAEEFHCEASDIIHRLQSMKQEGAWRQKGDLLEDSSTQKFELIIYDPFSSKTNGPLWTEEYLGQFLKRRAAESCVFTTYAATGALKRSLQSVGFTVERPEGFSGKRQRTYATRGLH